MGVDDILQPVLEPLEIVDFLGVLFGEVLVLQVGYLLFEGRMLVVLIGQLAHQQVHINDFLAVRDQVLLEPDPPVEEFLAELLF